MALEQPKKPGPGKDIADLKARLGLAKGAPPPTAGMPGMPVAAPTQPTAAFPGSGGLPPSPFATPVVPTAAVPQQPAPSPAAAPTFADPFASMRPPEGKHFDLRPVDDGKPMVNVHQKSGFGGRVITIIGILVAGAVGIGFGANNVGRRNMNLTNFGAKRVKAELEEMQKLVSEIGRAVAISQQQLARDKKDALAYDPNLVKELEKVKLDPRPDTSRIFKVNYFMLEDLAVDRLMNYYYDTITLFGEVERHIKRTKADQASIESFTAKMTDKEGSKDKPAVNYGVVFDTRGKLSISTLVEIGKPYCKSADGACPGDGNPLEGFEIRSNTGAPWAKRKVGPKPEGDKVVPIERTPLFEAVMNGSPDQVRMEQYKMRYQNIRQLLARLAATQKELADAINKAASRPDVFTI
jgi:hypothetical protein